MMQASPTRYLVLYPRNRRVISVISVVWWDSYRLTPLISLWFYQTSGFAGWTNFLWQTEPTNSDPILMPIFGWSPSSVSYSLCSMLQIPFIFYQNHHEFSSRKAQAAQVQVVLPGQGELLGTLGSERCEVKIVWQENQGEEGRNDVCIQYI